MSFTHPQRRNLTPPHHTHTKVAILLILGFTSSSIRAADPVLHAPLTRIRQVQVLSPEQAARSVPVHVTGKVTALSGYAHSFFLQDMSAGISVERSPTVVHRGDKVEVEGVSTPGYFAPSIYASQVRVLGQTSLPPPRSVNYADMIGGMQDSQYIQVRGIIHSARPAVVYGHQDLVLGLDVGGGSMRVMLQSFNPEDATRLIDAEVRLRGVCITDFNERRQFVGVGIIVAERSDMQILSPAPADPFAAPSIPIRNAMQFGQSRHRIKVQGTATYQLRGRALYIQDGSDSIQIQTLSPQPVAPGQWIEAVGFPVLGQYSPILADALFRVVRNVQPVKPMRIEASTVLHRPGEFTHADYDQQLVQIQGLVVGSEVEAGHHTLLLQDKGTVFEASFPVAGESALVSENNSVPSMNNFGVGSLLLLTGICTVNADFDRNPVSFSILLRSPDDVLVLRRGPWWTTAHLFLLLATSAIVIVVVALWVVILRRKVNQQTQKLRASEENFRYLATHDGLTRLLNRNAILDTLADSLEEAKARGTQIAVALVDLDNFKCVNDTLGHLAGDEVLRQAALRLSSAIREVDVVGRYGGEEFLIVFRQMSLDLSLRRCEELRRALARRPVVYEQRELVLTGSIGVACSHPDETTPALIVAQADAAMYKAKTGGRNRVELFTSAPNISRTSFPNS